MKYYFSKMSFSRFKIEAYKRFAVLTFLWPPWWNLKLI